LTDVVSEKAHEQNPKAQILMSDEIPMTKIQKDGEEFAVANYSHFEQGGFGFGTWSFLEHRDLTIEISNVWCLP
jgi:hypothetical protein